jgi:hypothetical protein
MNCPKIKNELKDIEQVVTDHLRFKMLQERINKRLKKDPNYIIKAQKSINRYIKTKFICYANVIEDISCKCIDDDPFKTSYDHLDKLNNYLSRLTKSTNEITNLTKVLSPNIGKLYVAKYAESLYKLVKNMLHHSTNSSQILEIITWVSKIFINFCKMHNLDYDKKIRHSVEGASKLYVKVIQETNHTFIANMVTNDYNSTKKKNNNKWLDMIDDIYYTGIIKLLFMFLIENIKIAHSSTSPILLKYTFRETLKYVQLFCNQYITIMQESKESVPLKYCIACLNNANKMVELFNKYLNTMQQRYHIKIHKHKVTNDITIIVLLFKAINQNFQSLLISCITKPLNMLFKNTDINSEYSEYFGTIIVDTIQDYLDNDVRPYLDADIFDEFIKSLLDEIISKLYCIINNQNKIQRSDTSILIISKFFKTIIDDNEYVTNKINTLNKIEI